MNRAKIKSWLYKIASLIIFAGFLMMCQPFSFTLYSFGFPVLLFGAVGFMVLDHLPEGQTGE